MTPPIDIVRTSKAIVAVVFVALVPIFLIALNVRWVVNFPPLYAYGFDRYDIPRYTGIQRDELISAGSQIRDYFSNDDELLAVNVVVRGVRVMNLYNEREVLHMRDVKALVRGVNRVSEVAGLYLAVVIAVGFATKRRDFGPTLARLLRWGGAVTLGLVVLVGLLSVVGFDRLFLVFHLISFSNDLWQLDPSHDFLIAMFPQSFFFDATMLIAMSIIVEALVLVIAPTVLLRRLQTPSPQSRSDARRAKRAETT